MLTSQLNKAKVYLPFPIPPQSLQWNQIDAKVEPDNIARVVDRQINNLDRNILDALHWLGCGYTPSRRTWYDFRDRAGTFIHDLHQQLVSLAISQGHAQASEAALDGSSVAACASRHHMVNQATLRKRKKLLEEAIASHATDEVTDRSEKPKWLPPTRSGRFELARRMERADKKLLERLAKNEMRPKSKRKDPNKIVVSLSDPDAPLGLDKLKTYRPMYTVQKMADPVSHITLSYMCEATTSDAGMLAPMIKLTQSIVGGTLETVLADGGYCAILDVKDALTLGINLIAPTSDSGTSRCAKAVGGGEQIPRSEFTYNAGTNSYTCPQGQTLDYKSREKQRRDDGRELYQSRYQSDPLVCGACERAGECLAGKGGRMIKRTEGEELLEDQRAKMETEESKTAYKRRAQTVELVYADSKGNRSHSRFHGRGIERARTETGLHTLAQNLLRLDNLQQRAKNPEKLAA
jgi:transposase